MEKYTWWRNWGHLYRLRLRLRLRLRRRLLLQRLRLCEAVAVGGAGATATVAGTIIPGIAVVHDPLHHVRDLFDPRRDADDVGMLWETLQKACHMWVAIRMTNRIRRY